LLPSTVLCRFLLCVNSQVATTRKSTSRAPSAGLTGGEAGHIVVTASVRCHHAFSSDESTSWGVRHLHFTSLMTHQRGEVVEGEDTGP
jgi:hypothetical protein